MSRLIHDVSLQQKLGLADTTIGISKESFKNLGKLDGSRDSVVKDVRQLVEKYDTVLIKWQYGDSILKSPQNLLKIFPSYQHKIIHLLVIEVEQIRRLQTKDWWHEVGNEKEFISDEVSRVHSAINELSEKYEVINFDWS